MAQVKFKDDPFITGYIINYSDNTQSLERDRLKYIKSVNDRFHIITEADSCGSIAFDYYGNSKLYWVIMDVNELEDPFQLILGASLVVPDLSKYNLQ